jgi:hypothetical protein
MSAFGASASWLSSVPIGSARKCSRSVARNSTHAFAAALCQYLVRLVVDAEQTVDLGRNQWCGRRDGRTSENPISQFRGTRERVRAAAGAADNEEPLEAKFVGNS